MPHDADRDRLEFEREKWPRSARPEPFGSRDYQADESAPETKEVFTEIACFFDKHLGK
jgi:hypothetical protein